MQSLETRSVDRCWDMNFDWSFGALTADHVCKQFFNMVEQNSIRWEWPRRLMLFQDIVVESKLKIDRMFVLVFANLFRSQDISMCNK